MKNKCNFYIPIEKVDKKKKMVYGYATTEAVDSQGEIIEKNAIKKAWEDYMQWANVREMHRLSAVGKTKEYMHDDMGTWIGVKVSDQPAWQKVLDEVYMGFSIGGDVLRKEGNKIKELILSEISLVDRPSNPESKFQMVKRNSEGVLINKQKVGDGKNNLKIKNMYNNQTDNATTTFGSIEEVEKTEETEEIEKADTNEKLVEEDDIEKKDDSKVDEEIKDNEEKIVTDKEETILKNNEEEEEDDNEEEEKEEDKEEEGEEEKEEKEEETEEEKEEGEEEEETEKVKKDVDEMAVLAEITTNLDYLVEAFKLNGRPTLVVGKMEEALTLLLNATRLEAKKGEKVKKVASFDALSKVFKDEFGKLQKSFEDSNAKVEKLNDEVTSLKEQVDDDKRNSKRPKTLYTVEKAEKAEGENRLDTLRGEMKGILGEIDKTYGEAKALAGSGDVIQGAGIEKKLSDLQERYSTKKAELKEISNSI